MSTAVVVWYLLVGMTQYNIVSIPQPSHEDCERQAKWIVQHRLDNDTPNYAFCVYGVKQ
jgi:hypothetical protein